MALTATASNSLRRQVMQTLGMRNASVISIPPNKNNIKYIVGQFETLDVSFGPLAEEVLVKEDRRKHGESTDLLSNDK